MNHTPMIDTSTQDAKVERIVSGTDRPGGQAPKTMAEEGRATSPQTSRKPSFRRPRARRKARALRKQRERNKRYRQRKEKAAMRRHPTLSNEEIAAVEEAAGFEARSYRADAGCIRAAPKPVAQDMRRRELWRQGLSAASTARGITDVCTYEFHRYAEQEIRAQGIPLDDPRAVDYFFDVLLPKHRGKTHDARNWVPAA